MKSEIILLLILSLPCIIGVLITSIIELKIFYNESLLFTIKFKINQKRVYSFLKRAKKPISFLDLKNKLKINGLELKAILFTLCQERKINELITKTNGEKVLNLMYEISKTKD